MVQPPLEDERPSAKLLGTDPKQLGPKRLEIDGSPAEADANGVAVKEVETTEVYEVETTVTEAPVVVVAEEGRQAGHHQPEVKREKGNDAWCKESLVEVTMSDDAHF